MPQARGNADLLTAQKRIPINERFRLFALATEDQTRTPPRFIVTGELASSDSTTIGESSSGLVVIDLAKGWLGASLPAFLNAAPEGSSELTALKIICGMAAIIGHVFPMFAGFRGGKGVATTFGVLLALHPALTLTCAGISWQSSY